jgi:hypothetical protein
MGKRRYACRVLVREPVGERLLGRTRRRCENNIKTYLQEIVLGARIGLILLRMWTGGGLL